MILDFHIHSLFSPDSLSKPKSILNTAKIRGLNGIAITDHNTIRGAIEVKKINKDRNFLVIVGAEIETEVGDIIGIFLTKEIKSRISFEVIKEIHQQDGIVILPHPYKGHQLSEKLLKSVDIIECYNSRISKEINNKAFKLAKRYKKPIIAGSDAHFCCEIGFCKTTYNSRNIREEILEGPKKIEIKYIPIHNSFASQIIKSFKTKKFSKIPFQGIPFFKHFLKSVKNKPNSFEIYKFT